MRRVEIIAISVAFPVFVVGVILYSTVNFNDITVVFYPIRANLFSGFLTVGSFLLSLKVFIVVKLKEGIYDSSEYRKTWKRYKAQVGLKSSLYEPLKNLNRVIYYSILLAFASAILNLTVGSIKHWSASLFCIFFSLFSVGPLGCTLYMMNKQLNRWLTDLEKKK